jgi:putative ABC transport system permease protein
MGAAAALALAMLTHQRRRLFLMAASVSVGVIVVIVEWGLFSGILDAQAAVAGLVRGDLIMMNKARVDLHRWDEIDPYELAQARGIVGVDRVLPIYEGHVGIKNPQDKRIRRIIVFAFPPGDPPLSVGDMNQVARLQGSNDILFDRQSRPIFGAIVPGMSVDIDRVPQRVAGLASIGPDIVSDGNIVMSDDAWLERLPGDKPIMGVIRLAVGARVDAVRNAILAALPADVTVLTPREVRTAPISVLFGAGVLAGLLIGVINCYQVLYTEISDHLAQFATLKALGFSDGFLRQVVLVQAMALGGAGFVVGLICASLAEAYVSAATRLPVQPHLADASWVLLATLATCALAGWIAVGRVQAADPAALY